MNTSIFIPFFCPLVKICSQNYNILPYKPLFYQEITSCVHLFFPLLALSGRI
ncbi:hypothetical protein JCM6294_1994 [Bacteroides pyogenes DSM 20611 = JCM 6294]|uniref:Uncharacterized protein n=1 Tax=Bacteroides pyogenes DSM 20611 = JCM 6294 TaxID=1121100 RepID=W4PHX4_9BACE|nr:hypothetical protein JCM6294_1994 [Bacteroides pyogenes DSM 20611 = JCM 6294]